MLCLCSHSSRKPCVYLSGGFLPYAILSNSLLNNYLNWVFCWYWLLNWFQLDQLQALDLVQRVSLHKSTIKIFVSRGKFACHSITFSPDCHHAGSFFFCLLCILCLIICKLSLVCSSHEFHVSCFIQFQQACPNPIIYLEEFFLLWRYMTPSFFLFFGNNKGRSSDIGDEPAQVPSPSF